MVGSVPLGGPPSEVTANCPASSTLWSLLTGSMLFFLHLQVLPDEAPGAQGCVGLPVPDRSQLLQAGQLAQAGQFIVYHLPDAGDVGGNLTAAPAGAAAGAVEEMLGTAGDGAEAAGEVDDAVPAGHAPFSEDPQLPGEAQEHGIIAGEDRLLREHLGHKIHPHAAGQRQNRVMALDELAGLLHQFLLALPLHHKLPELFLLTVEPALHAEG